MHVYAVQCQQLPGATEFWKELASRTHGTYLQLNDLSSIVQTLMAICYREAGAQPPQHLGPGASGAFDDAFQSSPNGPSATEETPGSFGAKKRAKKLCVGMASKKPGVKPLKATAKKPAQVKAKKTIAEVKDRRVKASNVHSVDKVAKKAREIKKKLSSRKVSQISVSWSKFLYWNSLINNFIFLLTLFAVRITILMFWCKICGM